MVGAPSAAASLVGFLSEPDTALQIFALEELNNDMDNIWTEVSGSIGQIEALYEDESFPNRELAALVAAKVYYQLQEYNESMVFALGAGKLFRLDHQGEFEETIVAKCIDTYVALSALQNPPAPSSSVPSASLNDSSLPTANGSANTTTPFSQSSAPPKSLLSREVDGVQADGAAAGVAGSHPAPNSLSPATQKSLHGVIQRIFESCYQTGAYRHVVGIAIEARSRQVLKDAILRCGKDKQSTDELMEYVLEICMNVVQERGLRDEILQLILELLNDIPDPDYFAIARCVVHLGQYSMASNMLRQLVQKADAKSLAIAYQLSFDLYENGTQEFLIRVMEELPSSDDKSPEPTSDGADDADESTQLLSELRRSTGPSGAKATTAEEKKAFNSIRDILRGTTSIELNLEFLFRNSHTDKHILNKVRDSLEARNSIFHTAVTFSNAFMNSGTTVDTFFRDNLEWLGKAVNWSKFTATAALGVIHRGNLANGRKLLEPYLPKRNAVAGTGSPYSQGGSLYALGLIYSNHGTNVLDYLLEQFKDTQEEVVQHGGALGLGVAGMATGSEDIYEALKGVLYSDSAINGEAVGLAMGLVMLGTGNTRALEDMIVYAHETQHEKIVRGLAMGMALIMYNRQEGADELINGLLDDADPALRYGGIFTVALAYCGTSSNKAVRKLLHVAVSDVSDDVRRAAVMSLGFVLFRKPGAVPRMVELLSESYNPHVRYGATMALGIACAGTGLDEAIDLLEPMMKDSVDFVRQGALISLSMIMVQQNEAMNPKVATIRKTLQKIISDRHEDAMCKFGCALALGIIDAGGRNCTIGLQTPTGNLNMSAIVGMAVFTQYWYWFPLTHFLTLSFTPTAIIGVDSDLEIPSFKFHSNTRPSVFDYPPEAEVKAEEAPEKVKAAVLSTTAHAKRREQAKKRQARRESMDIDTTPTSPKVESGDKMDMDDNVIDTAKLAEEKGEAATTDGSTKKKAEREKVGYELENMSRVLPAQIKYISFSQEGRYQPVKKPTGGVILLHDTQSSEDKSLLELKAKKKTNNAAAAPVVGGSSQQGATPFTPARQTGDDALAALSFGAGAGVGAAAASGVLNAVDEDVEGGEEAELPDEFEVEDEDMADDDE
ncbi:26S proteasome regulatory complex, non-ATPase subcomplex, Rpn2/Psmd1 subunit [Aureobasidium pullulans]|uniref:26S proteasome regulatory subunit RPN2 n=1 Tax=Aureobasidium pullulans TaxID=5580 RepID=A0A4S8YRE4_AURPU|nr:26S proteasome regulatory complex, non-ATPase subcomplex, Rpn2/Psmd1 subunit [Aureobasidium pullulans]TIA03455.1 26S proteasome regulatory complex, non-ATPase subcomplex, Rpn2/Psmd1 subunit [Aureobasidium pullulans]